ncbi:hypothetical protein [Streptomyces sp. 150FB]|jgi:hypothetical protein|uniref:hypothetical protein n=1 Tax=Streptomyces sp. 150FB TaxID=1576605 RepID=UPI00099D214A|nr:hypothetical protein [Streptomyces sp. 150FB]
MSASSSDSSGTTEAPAPVRSASVVNTEIRALWARAGGAGRALSSAEQERYQRLLVEWAAAVRADVVEAA